MAVERDNLDAGRIAFIGILSAILVFVTIVGLQAYFYQFRAAERVRKEVDRPPRAGAVLEATQREELNSYRWVDKTNGVVGIPIDRAMDLTVRDLAGR